MYVFIYVHKYLSTHLCMMFVLKEKRYDTYSRQIYSTTDYLIRRNIAWLNIDQWAPISEESQRLKCGWLVFFGLWYFFA